MILARNYMCSLMMISDRLSKYVGAVKSVLKKWFKINDIQLVHLLVVWYLVNLQDARCNNKDNFEVMSDRLNAGYRIELWWKKMKQGYTQGGYRAAALTNKNIKKTDFIVQMILKFPCSLFYGRDRSLKSADG